MILEGILTTTGEDGRVNIAPMGAGVPDSPREPLSHIVLRPFRDTATCANLKRSGQAVFHVTDNVEMLARAAVGRADPPPELFPTSAIEGWIIADACRWYALRVRHVDDTHPRGVIEADVVDHGRRRDFFGLNRAMHAVVEAAILATRLSLVPAEQVREELARLAVLVEKTGGAGERAAFQFLVDYVAEATGEPR